ncbi:MAG: hypothetical protein ACREEY_11745 [Brevundimonas sp.]
MSDRVFKVDVRWPDEGRVDRKDRTETRDPVAAISAFRRLLSRTDLEGRPAAARLMVDGKRLYYSEFWKPIGDGRIHPDAPITLEVDRDGADEIGRWLPLGAAPNPQFGSKGAPGAAAATVDDGSSEEARELAAFFADRSWSIRDSAGQIVPLSHVARSLLSFLDAPL